MKKTPSAKARFADILTKAGLEEKESVVYETLLKAGELGIGELLKKIPYKRGDAYNILYSLENKGLVEQTLKKGRLHFLPRDPNKVRDYIENQREKYFEGLSLLTTILPEMLSEFNLTVAKPSIGYFEGYDGLKKVYNELNNSGTKELLLFRSVFDDKRHDIDKIVLKQLQKQVQLGIRTKTLTPLVKESRKTFLELDKKRLVTRHLVERKRLSLPAQILIWQNTTAIISLRDKIIATIIESREIALTFRTIFHYIWQSTEKFHQKTTRLWLDHKSAQDDYSKFDRDSKKSLVEKVPD